MNSEVSLIILTHNRQNYLRRVLEYYLFSGIPVFVADSSDVEFDPAGGKYNNDQLRYFHIPQKSLTGKIAYVLEKITTPFVQLCADDDFVIPDAIFKCVDFLSENQSFSAAMGNAICYRRDPASKNNIDFFAFYTDRLSFRTLEKDAFARVDNFFKSYRTIFYAVHRTEILKKTFEGAEKIISNLFLNEYITAIYPLVKGHFIEIPLLYYVREYSEYSRDKTIDNIDAILYNDDLKSEYEHFLAHQAGQIAPVVNQSFEFSRESLRSILMRYARVVYDIKQDKRISLDKKIGKFIRHLPFIGLRIITAYRKKKNAAALPELVRTENEKKQLSVISDLINKYDEVV